MILSYVCSSNVSMVNVELVGFGGAEGRFMPQPPWRLACMPKIVRQRGNNKVHRKEGRKGFWSRSFQKYCVIIVFIEGVDCFSDISS